MLYSRFRGGVVVQNSKAEEARYEDGFAWDLELRGTADLSAWPNFTLSIASVKRKGTFCYENPEHLDLTKNKTSILLFPKGIRGFVVKCGVYSKLGITVGCNSADLGLGLSKLRSLQARMEDNDGIAESLKVHMPFAAIAYSGLGELGYTYQWVTLTKTNDPSPPDAKVQGDKMVCWSCKKGPAIDFLSICVVGRLQHTADWGRRNWLHRYALEFEDDSGHSLRVESPMPEELKDMTPCVARKMQWVIFGYIWLWHSHFVGVCVRIDPFWRGEEGLNSVHATL